MATKRRGWILNVDRDEQSREIESYSEPVLTLDDGEIVFEVWKWYPDLSRWFVLSWTRNPTMEAQGVIYYTPNEVPHGLRARVQAMRKMMLGARVAG